MNMKFIKEHLLWVVKFMDMAVRLGRAILPLAPIQSLIFCERVNELL